MNSTGAPAPSGDATRAERRIVVRATTLTPAEAARVEAQAEAAGLPLADYLRARLLADHGAGEGDVALPAREVTELLGLLRAFSEGEREQASPGAGPAVARAAALAEALERALPVPAPPPVSAPSATR